MKSTIEVSLSYVLSLSVWNSRSIQPFGQYCSLAHLITFILTGIWMEEPILDTYATLYTRQFNFTSYQFHSLFPINILDPKLNVK